MRLPKPHHDTKPRRHASKIGAQGPQRSWIWPADGEDSPNIAHRESRVDALDGGAVCPGCGARVEDDAHHPRCSETAE